MSSKDERVERSKDRLEYTIRRDAEERGVKISSREIERKVNDTISRVDGRGGFNK